MFLILHAARQIRILFMHALYLVINCPFTFKIRFAAEGSLLLADPAACRNREPFPEACHQVIAVRRKAVVSEERMRYILDHDQSLLMKPADLLMCGRYIQSEIGQDEYGITAVVLFNPVPEFSAFKNHIIEFDFHSLVKKRLKHGYAAIRRNIYFFQRPAGPYIPDGQVDGRSPGKCKCTVLHRRKPYRFSHSSALFFTGLQPEIAADFTVSHTVSLLAHTSFLLQDGVRTEIHDRSRSPDRYIRCLQDFQHRIHHNLYVAGKGNMIHIPDIIFKPLIPVEIISAVDLCETR